MPVTDWQHVVKTIADALKAMAQGIEALADRVEEVAREQTESPAKSAGPRKGQKAAKKPARKKTAASSRSAKNKSTKKKSARSPAAKQSAKTAKAPSGASGVMDQVHQAVRKANGPLRTADVAEQTGLAPKQVTNALYKLKKQKKVKSPGKGVYEAT